MAYQGKVVLVTGAGRGMGEHVARSFAAEGASVCLADLDGARAAAVTQSIVAEGRPALAVTTDVRDVASVRSLFAAVEARFGGLDVLVNMAGGYGEAFRKSDETPVDEWDMVVDSNLKGSFLCAKYAVPLLRKRGGGRIINFSSNAGRTVSPLLGCSYTAAKAGVIGLSRHLAKEFAPENILVNTVAPGPAEGDRLADLLDEGGRAALAGQIPLGRLATAGDIAGVVLFLASDAARFMTGAILDVNGGYVLA
jgi:3-oxoacyl-[acyl-carrier protein] reductase